MIFETNIISIVILKKVHVRVLSMDDELSILVYSKHWNVGILTYNWLNPPFNSRHA